METLEDLARIHAPIDRCFDLAESVEVHLAGNVHSDESARVAAGDSVAVDAGQGWSR